MLPRPSLEINGMQRPPKLTIPHCHILNSLEPPIKLPNAPHGHPTPLMEYRVLYQDIRTVGLGTNRVISIDDFPAIERDVVRVDGVCSIGVDGPVSAMGSAVYIDVFEQNIFRVDDSHGPHLALDEAETREEGVGCVGDGESVWTARKITRSTDEIVPDLAVAIEGAIVVAVERDVIAAEEPCGGLHLVAHREGVGEPVGDVF